MNKFWLTTPMTEMTHEQWESLCDGCGKCCRIQYLDDDDSSMLMQTDVACRLLDTESLRCNDYDNRLKHVNHCLQITPETVQEYYWLPDTCAYRVVARGDDLPSWHHLVSGDRESIHKEGKSLRGLLVSERDIDERTTEDRIISWIAITD